MKTRPTNSSLVPPLYPTESVPLSTTESQKSWHLLGLLLSIGRPATPIELASRCTLFPASPELIKFLCSVPNSPISLTEKRYVTLSLVGLIAFGEYVSNSNLIDAFRPRIEFFGARGVLWEDFLKIYFSKRKRVGFDYGYGDKEDQLMHSKKRAKYNHIMVHDRIIGNISGSTIVKFTSGTFSCKLKEIEYNEDKKNHETFVLRRTPQDFLAGKSITRSIPLSTIQDHMSEPRSIVHMTVTNCLEEKKKVNTLTVESGSSKDAFRAADTTINENERIMVEWEKEGPIGLDSPKGGCDLPNLPPGSDFEWNNVVIHNDKIPSLGKEPTTTGVVAETIFPAHKPSVTNKKFSRLSAKSKVIQQDTMAVEAQSLCKFMQQNKAVNTPREKLHHKKDQVPISMVQKSKLKHINMPNKKRTGNFISMSAKDELKPKILPTFESYIVEEEEGSGGYGTVYRARRKSDGVIVAIKCPHANARGHHVNNELRMLERFGGKNFVIKYEGCFRSGNSDCFVLEHVEHDRPEVLKKEIDIFQLQWYGYCLFRALASLHKQGAVHRDVKPGNFLFSREVNKGYLIDFNLAMDVHQKNGTTKKSKVGHDVRFNHISLPNAKAKSVTASNDRMLQKAKYLSATNQDQTKGLKLHLESTNPKKKAVVQTKAYNELGVRNKFNSQGADGSGVTSAKDVTSTRTPSAEKLREPLPSCGRKELISLLQEAMQSPNHKALHVPAPMRKRVAASPRNVDTELVYLTPMPLHSTGRAGLVNTREDKNKREGPCAGTKGFRAPEVLFRSQYQGPKIDVWSAGVSLLYLMTGRTPFIGDPEQNIKDIAKLRGSEDLWEVAKLHNRESLFPQDLYDAQYLPSLDLKDWCQMNTKRREFLEVIPKSLFDLVNKCLTVNPRLRISAEEALQHEFFAPCHDVFKKQRLLKQGLRLDCGTDNLLNGKISITPSNICHEQA